MANMVSMHNYLYIENIYIHSREINNNNDKTKNKDEACRLQREKNKLQTDSNNHEPRCNEASCRRAHATRAPCPHAPWPSLLQVLIARGATFVDGGNWACNVQHDGQVFTGQNPMSATAIGKTIAAALASA